jgi:competence protein ComEC
VFNLLWLPVLFAWVFPWALTGLLLCAVPGLSLPASWALGFAAWPITWLFKLLAAMDAAHILIAPLVVRPHSVSMLGYGVLLVAMFLCLRNLDYARMFPTKRRKGMGHIKVLFLAGMLCLSFGIWERYAQEHPPGLRVRVLDVGHGLAMLLEGKEGQRVLVDGGGSALSAFNVGEHMLTPLLTANRPPRLDAVINTHPDADHLRGLLPILRRFEVGTFWLTRPPSDEIEVALLEEALSVRGVEPRQVEPGQRLKLDSAHYVHVLYPPVDKVGSRNELSLVAQVVYAPDERGLLLITGDVTKRGTRETMKESARIGFNLRSDVLQVPHHGSKNNLVKAFYEVVAPQAAVVSTGYANQWGLPAEVVREALLDLDILLLNTATCGQIVLRWNNTDKSLDFTCSRMNN